MWAYRPDMGIALALTWPSGDEDVVRARECVIAVSRSPEPVFQPSAVLRIVHQSPVVLPIPIDSEFVGSGLLNQHPRPGAWSVPYPLPSGIPTRKEYGQRCVDQRRDVKCWLAPLFGKVLICDCGNKDCHAEVLAEFIDQLVLEFNSDKVTHSSPHAFPRTASKPTSTLTATSACSQTVIEHPAGRDRDCLARDRLDEVVPHCSGAPGMQSTVDSAWRERCAPSPLPSWPDSWCQMVDLMRGYPFKCFWELFAGAAILTSSFRKLG